ncbi:MFS transporter [Herbihabitans rhizosphaerae]|uniref:MFS transporter n=1 Tax=Herbihabitans rhizosphaerae TaxID=1872711 RepID=A0A4Q7L5G0_9PSEU|nr:MFS transporter [Herbihabitans rhizosphaerae]RZS43781.1 MFS transporter [Herbihabitans rhizosphaerae]
MLINHARRGVLAALCVTVITSYGVLYYAFPVLAGAITRDGAARGIFTLLQATAITDRWGPAHYGRLNGVLSAPAMVATAVAPGAGAVLAGPLGGYPAMFLILGGIGLAAVVTAAAARPVE